VSVIDRIVEQARESKRRKENIIAAVAALSPEERREVLAELILQAEADEAKTSSTPEKRPRARRRVAGPETTYTEKAEAYVLANPQGVKTVDVSKAIGQDASSVDGTLRNLMKRGRITRQGRLWVPVPTKTNNVAAQPPRPERMTIRDRITQVFKDNGNKPLGAAELFEALKRVEPEINRSSVDGEMNRMRKDNLLVQAGTGPHGGGLYNLKTEATTRPA
jgi:hypothetical protein